MAHVITQSCCNDAACVAVCPVDCIHPRPDEPDYRTAEMLYIDPQTCIDCGACALACPIEAIFPEDRLPENLALYGPLNEAFYRDSRPRSIAPVLTDSPTKETAPYLRVAIVGCGPAGFYAASELLSRRDIRAEVHMIDRLPTPGGLIRAGVAPDHQRTKSFADTFDRIAEHPDVHYHLGVDVGRDVSHADLTGYFHAVIYAVGASTDRTLGIPGEQLPGSHAAADFVAWYNGHPDHAADRYDLSGERAVIIGNGNVALDVARILLTDPDLLAHTDIADHALQALRNSAIREVVIVGRRGPAEAGFTTPELLGLADLDGVDITVEGPNADSDDPKATVIARYAAGPHTAERRIALRFFNSPIEILGDGHVTGIRLVRNELKADADGTAQAVPTDTIETIDTALVLRSIGFRGNPIEKLPFDDERGLMPNDGGRVVAQNSSPGITGVYVTGWIKRGATGVIGTNKQCAEQTVAALLADAAQLAAPVKTTTDIADLWAAHGIRTVGKRGWRAIDDHERARGRASGRPRVKETSIETLMALGTP